MQQESTYFLHCYIAGLQYYEVLEACKDLKIGDVLDLIPEANNRYDKQDVIVAYGDHKLGYLPRSQNRPISKIPLAGHDAYTARIQSPYSDNPIHERIEIRLNVKSLKRTKKTRHLNWCPELNVFTTE